MFHFDEHQQGSIVKRILIPVYQYTSIPVDLILILILSEPAGGVEGGKVFCCELPIIVNSRKINVVRYFNGRK